MNAQQNNLECATPEPTENDPTGVYSHSTDIEYFNNEAPIVLNIYFWGINRPDGTNDYPNRADSVLQALANLNILYNQFNIFFKYRGFQEIDSPILPNDSNGYYILESTSHFHGLTAWAAANGYKKDDSFNVYAYGWGTGFGGISPGYNVTTCGISSGNLTGEIMPHEIGHNLNLKHTRSSTGINGERVTRDPNNSNYNADQAGDEVVDTAANPGYRDPNGTYPYINLNTCEYENDGTQVDYDGDAYKPIHADVINVMSNAYICMDEYSPLSIGQGIRAREALEEDRNEQFAPTITTIASLYEPYAGEYFDPNNPNDILYKPLFQPGFEYRFIECDCECPEPTPYGDISFSYTQNIIKTVSKYESDFSTIYHPNHTAIAIRIEDPIFWPQPRRCYDNDYRRPIGGTVTRFNDNIFNTNVTITPKDSLGINNLNLIDELDAGLYKIEMNYEQGNTEETVIFKEE